MAGASLSRRSARSASWLFVVGWLIIAASLPQKILAAAVPSYDPHRLSAAERRHVAAVGD